MQPSRGLIALIYQTPDSETTSYRTTSVRMTAITKFQAVTCKVVTAQHTLSPAGETNSVASAQYASKYELITR